MAGIKLSELKQIPDPDVTDNDSLLILDSESQKSKRVTMERVAEYVYAAGTNTPEYSVYFKKDGVFAGDSRFIWDYNDNFLSITKGFGQKALYIEGDIYFAGVPLGIGPVSSSIQNLAFGIGTLSNNTDGIGNISFGENAGNSITVGEKNVFIGTGAGSIVQTGDGNIILGAYAGTAGLNKSIVLSTGDTGEARLFINSSGQVGIGTTSPQEQLEVYGGSYNARIGPRSWWGGSSYPTVYGSSPDSWIMLGFPHIPYLENGVNGFTAGSVGALLRYANKANPTAAWDTGIASNIGEDKYVIRRDGSATPFLSISNVGNVAIEGDLEIGGKITAREYHTEIVSASIIYEEGDTKFGNDLLDTHQFTGSVNITGSISVDNINTDNIVAENIYVDNIFGAAEGQNKNIQFNSGSDFSGSDNFVWDYELNRLGVNTSTPESVLHVRDTAFDFKIETSDKIPGGVGFLLEDDLSGSSAISYLSGNLGIYIRGDNLSLTETPDKKISIDEEETVFKNNILRAEGATEANLLFVSASNDRVGIGTDSPSHTLTVVGDISASNYVGLPTFGDVVSTQNNTFSGENTFNTYYITASEGISGSDGKFITLTASVITASVVSASIHYGEKISAGGSEYEVQFNSGSFLSGSPNLVYDYDTGILSGTIARFTVVSASEFFIDTPGVDFSINETPNTPNGTGLLLEDSNPGGSVLSHYQGSFYLYVRDAAGSFLSSDEVFRAEVDNVVITNDLVVTGSIYNQTQKIENKTGTYGLQSSDSGKTITVNVGSSTNITVPVSLPDGFFVKIIQLGTGQLTIVGDIGVTINKPSGSSASTRTRYSVVELLNIGSNQYVLSGDMA